MDLAKYRYYMDRKLERRRNRIPEKVIEHEMKRYESERKKRMAKFDKIFKKYNLDEKKD